MTRPKRKAIHLSVKRAVLMRPRTVEELLAGDEFRSSLIPNADSESCGALLWHGWALMDSFLAGIDWARKNP